MQELVTAYWPILLAAFLIGIAVAWYVFAASRKTSVTSHSKDVLDDGAAPAARNQALIDAPPAAAGELSSAANTREVAHASAQADAEAGPAIAPSKPEVSELQSDPGSTSPAPASPAPASPAPASQTPASGDDLTRIKGLGPKLAAMLGTLGVTTYEQIAGWSDDDIAKVDAKLGRFQGRITRDDWVTQARLLADGDEAGFAGRYGNTR